MWVYTNANSYTPNVIKEEYSILYDEIIKEKARIERRIVAINNQLKNFPEGKLIVTKNGDYNKWYLSNEEGRTYIPKENRSFAEKLAFKKYLILQLSNLNQELTAIKQYLRSHDSEANLKEELFLQSKKYKELLYLTNPNKNENVYKWMYEPYPKNTSHPEHLIHKTYSGNYVRSKSEAMIESFLYKYQIPFRYECLLDLGDTFFYPDFTIRHPETGEIKYWENFGMMDDSKYSRNTFSKLDSYVSHGIIPGNQLITTYETRTQPLTTDKVVEIIENFLEL